MTADQNFYDMFYIFYPMASAMAYGRNFSGRYIRLWPKVKIVPTVQHCLGETGQTLNS